jgi:F0F1-type ATP synthase assembly protein I
MKHAYGTRRFCSIFCGAALAAAGMLLLGVKMGWIPDEVFRSIPFFPMALIFFGALLIYSSARRRRTKGETGDGAGA